MRPAGPPDPLPASPRPSRRQGGRPGAIRPLRDTEPPWGKSEDRGRDEVEPSGSSGPWGPSGPWGRHALGRRAAAQKAEPGGAPGRTIETIAEVPAPAGPVAPRPASPQPAGPPAPPLQPGPSRRPPVATAAALPQGEESGTLVGLPRARPEPLRRVPPTAPREPGDVAPAPFLPARPLAPGSPQGSASARGARPETAPAPAPPAIHVTIGRIEVRATPQRAPALAPAPRPAAPKLSLDEYLRSRRGRAV
jgi:hypothetical protein